MNIRLDGNPLRGCGPLVTYVFNVGDAIVVTMVYAKSRGKKFVNVTLCEALKSIREMRSYVDSRWVSYYNSLIKFLAWHALVWVESKARG